MKQWAITNPIQSQITTHWLTEAYPLKRQKEGKQMNGDRIKQKQKDRTKISKEAK